MMGAFLVPILSSNQRGLTHLTTCQEEAESPFTLVVEEGREPTILTSQFFTAEDATAICGLEFNIRARSRGQDRIEMILPIQNTTRFAWHGSVKLRIGKTSVPIRVGQIPAGKTEQATVTLPHLPRGQTMVDGSLLIGP
jgi:hypothetical protein